MILLFETCLLISILTYQNRFLTDCCVKLFGVKREWASISLNFISYGITQEKQNRWITNCHFNGRICWDLHCLLLEYILIRRMKFVPMKIMIFAFCYILLQIIKRFIFRKQNWWDWLYYIGLLAIVIPSYLATDSNYSAMLLFAQVGTCFLIIPLIFDIIGLVRTSN